MLSIRTTFLDVVDTNAIELEDVNDEEEEMMNSAVDQGVTLTTVEYVLIVLQMVFSERGQK